MKIAPLLAGMALLAAAPSAMAQDHLIIHEWGTFTSLEDEHGRAIPGINVDDEPVPAFVHRLLGWLVLPETLHAQFAGKGLPGVNPDVTLRLETPVFYVHAPAGFAGPLDVRVAFQGGWLTEYYPDAEALAPGVDRTTGRVGHLTADTVGELHWSGLTLGGTAPGPAATDPVWLAPRAVAADPITACNGESERFLFYRGVGHIDPALHFLRDPATGDLSVPPGVSPRPQRIWLADIRPDGTAAFRTVDLGGQGARMPGAFPESEYGAGRIAELRADLEAALIGQGLYKDEAEALLNTWAVSYFKSPGMRAFFMVPRTWTDSVLPLRVTPAADITRVMVGRIELVTPAQRMALDRLDMTPMSDADAAAAYAALGRFREALALSDGGAVAARFRLSYSRP